uniref:FACT complex subunit SSRP1 n=1 Tax=Tanacetum cinerariifolium TaxID=118510 RepID=A0A699K1K9_TANCI|nr:FACT complex subunit SSRP1 [Tanacetum cinerariifolium]
MASCSSNGLKTIQAASGVAAAMQDEVDDVVDPHLERIRNAAGEESDDEAEDFVADNDDDGSPSDDSGGDDSDGSASGGATPMLVDESDIN